MQGFVLSAARRAPLRIPSGAIAFVSADLISEVQALTLPGEQPSCLWQGTQGGAIDDPTDCEKAYKPPSTSQYDEIGVLMRSGCGLDAAVGRIRVGVLP